MLDNKTDYIVDNQYSKRSFYDSFKRSSDVLFGVIGIIVSVPVIIIIGIIVKLETPGPIFYSQERLGKDGKKFYIYKIRSMYKNAEENGAQWAEKNDFRVTKVGNFIRKTRIDELPQFYNILIGDMSLIGPRPEREIFAEVFQKEIPNFHFRLRVKPGLTGWAQVNGGYDHKPHEKLQYDLYYIENKSFQLDFKILLKTVFVVIKGEGAR